MQREKTRTTVRIAGKDYTISSYDSAAYVERVAAIVNRKMSELGMATRLPTAQLAVLTAISATDDMLKSRDEIGRLRREVDGLRDRLEEEANKREVSSQEIDRLNAAIQARDGEIERLTAALEVDGADA